MMPYRNAPRGGSSAGLPPAAFVSFIQNHDQIGNRAFGERLNALVAAGRHSRACERLSARSADPDDCSWARNGAQRQPFLFFCDFGGKLADAVRKGRREEFSRFPEFADPERVAKIPDPSAEATFLASKLDWSPSMRSIWLTIGGCSTTRREFVRPLLPYIEHGGEALVLGEQAVRVTWRAGERLLVLDANLSTQPRRRCRRSEGSSLLALRRHGGRPWALGACAGESNPHEHSARDLSPATSRRLRLRCGRRRSRPTLRGSASVMSTCLRSSRPGPAACTATTSPTTTN